MEKACDELGHTPKPLQLIIQYADYEEFIGKDVALSSEVLGEVGGDA